MKQRNTLTTVTAVCLVTLAALPAQAQEAKQRTTVLRLPAEVKRSITRGLEFFAKTQNADGSCGEVNVTGGTALALMSFMVQGHVPGEGKYGKVTDKAIAFLLSVEKDSYFHHDSDRGMYEHGLALLALSEAWGQSKDPRIRPALVRGVKVTLNSQNDKGGWRYGPQPAITGDTSCSSMQAVALASAREAGIAVPDKAIRRAVDFFLSCEVRSTGGFSYSSLAGASLGRAGLALTAASTLSLMLSGEHKHAATLGGVAFISAQPDSVFEGGNHYWYGHYYAAQVMYQAGDEHFNKWYPKISKGLLGKQKEDGSWGLHGGNPVDTGFAILTLGVPYRFLPIYQK